MRLSLGGIILSWRLFDIVLPGQGFNDPLEPLKHLFHLLLVIYQEAYDQVEDISPGLEGGFIRQVTHLSVLKRFLTNPY